MIKSPKNCCACRQCRQLSLSLLATLIHIFLATQTGDYRRRDSVQIEQPKPLYVVSPPPHRNPKISTVTVVYTQTRVTTSRPTL